MLLAEWFNGGMITTAMSILVAAFSLSLLILSWIIPELYYLKDNLKLPFYSAVVVVVIGLILSFVLIILH